MYFNLILIKFSSLDIESNVLKTFYECKNINCECFKNAFLCGAEGSLDISEMLTQMKGPASIECVYPPNNTSKSCIIAGKRLF